MAVLHHDHEPSSGGMLKVLAIGAVMVALVAGAYFAFVSLTPPAPGARTGSSAWGWRDSATATRTSSPAA